MSGSTGSITRQKPGALSRKCQRMGSPDPDRRELLRGATHVSIEPKVFDLLAYLVENRERVVTKEDLIVAIWGGRIVSDSALTTRLNAARTAIGDSGQEQRLIKTLLRKGAAL